jgi:hypothetical protein
VASIAEVYVEVLPVTGKIAASNPIDRVDFSAKSAKRRARGEHYMQVSKWLGHSSFVITLTTYADYIREDDTAAPNRARPIAAAVTNVVVLERKKSDTA